MGHLAACMVVLGLWVSGAQGVVAAPFEADVSFQCSKFGSRASVYTKRAVIGMEGGTVMLPCIFSLTNWTNQVYVQWRVSRMSTIIFTSETNFTEGTFTDRLGLVGDLRKGQANISISDLRPGDKNVYYCDILERPTKQNNNLVHSDNHGTYLDIQEGLHSATTSTCPCTHQWALRRSLAAISVCFVLISMVSVAAFGYMKWRQNRTTANTTPEVMYETVDMHHDSLVDTAYTAQLHMDRCNETYTKIKPIAVLGGEALSSASTQAA
ncbi:uncharacterized protein LOC133360561 [Lethenteron reissneri]|uniref:uncharacterized protein LOC133360561 n=1 Tax=Lethenteron reissneri TaxID=7753 RepID=UPI002AB78500|nr:uncharacterized protein LOC133360561 [Lethenteron reissneri]